MGLIKLKILNGCLDFKIHPKFYEKNKMIFVNISEKELQVLQICDMISFNDEYIFIGDGEYLRIYRENKEKYFSMVYEHLSDILGWDE